MSFYKKPSKQQLIEKIHNLARTAESKLHRQECQKVADYYVRNGFIPSNLVKRCMELVELNKYRKVVEQERFYLYAISNLTEVKVGYSKDPKHRLKCLQTGSASKLELNWCKYCAASEKEARKQERMIHRRLGKFKIRGEWFDKKALNLIYQYRVKNLESKQDEVAEDLHRAMDSELLAIIS